MVHRAGAGAEVEHGGQCAGEVVLRASDGRVEIIALGEVGRDGARERAAGSVGVGVVDALAVEPLVAAVAVQEVVGIVEPVPALAQDGAAVALADGFPAAIMSSGEAMVRPESTSASGMFGVSTVASGSSRASSVAMASSEMSRAPLVATITGSTTMFVAA